MCARAIIAGSSAGMVHQDHFSGLQALDLTQEEEGGRVLWWTSVRRSCPETGAAEFRRARGWVAPPCVLGAQLHGKCVRGKHFRARASWQGDHFASTYPIFLGFEMKKRIKFTQVAGLDSVATLKPVALGIVIASRDQQLIHGRSRNPHQVTLYGLLSHKSHRCHLHDKRILLQIKSCNVLLVQSVLHQNLTSYYLLNTDHMNIMTP